MTTLIDAYKTLTGQQQQDLIMLRSYVENTCPITLRALRVIDAEYTATRKPKGFYLDKRDNKKLGFVYYVRYWHEGRMLPSKWCTHTNQYEAACRFAETNRSAIIARYLDASENAAVRFFKRFFDAASPVYQAERLRNGELSEGRRKRYYSVMTRKFIPFLKKNRIRSFEHITVHLLDNFQDSLLADGMKPQSVNDDIGAIHRAFKYLVRKGITADNPCAGLCPVPVRPGDKKTHGCYEIHRLKGVFERRGWKSKISQLLNLLIYTTDMRNCEITWFRGDDIITVGGCRFIELKRSKTVNGLRLVPLHEAVYTRIAAYAKGMNGQTPIFGDISTYQFKKATRDLGRMLNVSGEFLKEQNISYYSGRHFWKTLMNAEGLGEDAEEVFMGHKVSGNVSKLYNHRDMQGKRLLLKKAREVFRILDKRIFK